MKKIGPIIIMTSKEYNKEQKKLKKIKNNFKDLKDFSENLILEIELNKILISRYEKMLNINKKEEN